MSQYSTGGNSSNSCNEVISFFLKYLHDGFEIVSTEHGCLIVTPFQRLDGDFIEIEVILQIDGTFRLTDNGDTSDYLWLNGLNTKRKGMKQMMNRIAERFYAKFSDGEIVTFSQSERLGASLHNMLSAVQGIGYLIHKREFRGTPTFDEEVEKLIIANKINYEIDLQVKVKLAIYTFRFFVNGSKNVLIQPLTATTPNSAYAKAERLSSRWVDVKEYYALYKKTTVIEDTGKKAEIWEPRSIDILERRSDHLIRWSQKEKLVEILKSYR